MSIAFWTSLKNRVTRKVDVQCVMFAMEAEVPCDQRILHLGRYLYDVRTEGGGVTQYVTNTTDRLRECMTKGGGVQNPKNFADVI